MRTRTVNDFKGLVSKKRISNNLHQELSQKLDKIIEKHYPNLPKYDPEHIKKLKNEYDAGNHSVLNEYEMIMLSRSFEMLKDFYIRYNITNYDFEDALSDMYLINHKTSIDAFKKYSTSWFNYHYLQYFESANERHIWLIFAKYGLSNVDIAQTFIHNELKSVDELEIETVEDNPDDVVIFNDFHDHLIDVIKTLSAKEQAVLKKYFGIDSGSPLTMREVGEVYGVSAERIRQVVAEALRKMRHPYRSQHIKDFSETTIIND